jgi:phosphate transport system protein
VRENFRRNLADVQAELADLADTAASTVEQATTALIKADLSAAESTERLNNEIRGRLTEVENQTYDLLALQAPVASDLRILVMVVRLGADIARMGSLAGHIAETARLRHPQHVLPDALIPAFEKLGEAAKRMATEAGAALRSRKTTDAARLTSEDDVVDQLRLDLFQRIAESWPYGAETAADVALLGRYYERFADHAVAIGDGVIYLVTGLPAEQGAE